MGNNGYGRSVGQGDLVLSSLAILVEALFPVGYQFLLL